MKNTRILKRNYSYSSMADNESVILRPKRFLLTFLANVCLTVALVCLASLAMSAEGGREPSGVYVWTTEPIPQQVLMCDLAGVGRICNTSPTQIDMVVEQYWLGNPGTNRLTLRCNIGFNDESATNSAGVFFATTNLWWAIDSTNFLPERVFSWSMVTNPPPVYDCSVTNWTVIHDRSRFFPVDMDNGAVCAFASNLVRAARIEHNSTNFFGLVRNGSTNSVKTISRHVRTYVFYCRQYLPCELVNDVFEDIAAELRKQ